MAKEGGYIIDENWLSIDLLAIDRFQDGQSNDKREIVRGYIYEVLSGRQNGEERGTKENGAVGRDHHPKTPLFFEVRNFKPKNNKDLVL